jgi:Uma2 family endonuclease|tara:strand:+ start:197 stop:769 length:573 start_codon:yes stop_codon:yes gene_type:complete
MEAVRPRVSYSDLERAPEDGRRYELYDGAMFVVPSPLVMHQRATRELLLALNDYSGAHGGEVLISPIDIVFTEYDVLQPDLVFFHQARVSLIAPDRPIRVPPDLAVEVLSPSTAATDRGKKMQVFARFGVQEYWIVDPKAQTMEVYKLESDAFILRQLAGVTDVLGSPTLEGFECRVARIFPSGTSTESP